MSIITLTSDWSSSDFYVGVIKGKLLSKCKDCQIIDISHRIQPFNTSQAAFVVRNAFPEFPEGSIHMIFVNTEPSDDKPFLAVLSKGHYFIGTDNGIFSMICGENAEKIVELPATYKVSSFSAFEVFCEAASKLANGESIGNIGKTRDHFIVRMPLRPTLEDTSLTGSIIFIDPYQNAVTNISKELFDKVSQGRDYEIFVQSKHYRIGTISNFYHDVQAGDLLAIFNSAGLLEIAINNGNAARLLNLDTNSTVRIEFKARMK